MSETRRGVEYAGIGRTRHGDSVACYSKGCEHAENGRLAYCRRHLLGKWRRPRLGDLAIEPNGPCLHFVVGIPGENYKPETDGRG